MSSEFQPRFEVLVECKGQSHEIRISGPSATGDPLSKLYTIPETGQQACLDLHASLARDFGARMPRNRRAATLENADCDWQPLLTRNLDASILYGYGDPAVIRADDEQGPLYYLACTSNDAPDAFPILRSRTLTDWVHCGFAFPGGRHPAWTAEGLGTSDFWAPEIHKIREQYFLCFSAREADSSLSIAIARSEDPAGPFEPPARPLLGGGMIDANLLVEEDASVILVWKSDSNGQWPPLLAELFRNQPDLIPTFFADPADRRAAELAVALWPWISSLERMEVFFLLQPLVEAVVDRFAAIRRKLTSLNSPEVGPILEAMRTPIFAQQLDVDALELVGERRVILVNDLEWEGHLIEGPWLTRQNGLYYLFYSGNDFSTDEYGIGVAVSSTPWGPFQKMEQPLLRSNSKWGGPGHPSVAEGPDGVPRLFFHAYFPGYAGYKSFRALLTVPLAFEGESVRILPADGESA